jgi:repressor LexA
MLVVEPGWKLTARQSAIVAFIRAHVADHGYPPTVRDIGQAVGLVSPSSVAYQLGELARRGAIRRDPNLTRAIVVLDPDGCPTCGRTGAVG